MNFFRVLIAIFALIMIAVGMVTAITPIPFGLPLVVIGFLLLATASPATLKFIRKRWRWLDRRLVWLQEKLPRSMTRSLRRSDPNTDEDEDMPEEDAVRRA